MRNPFKKEQILSDSELEKLVEEDKGAPFDKLTLKNILKIGVPIFVLAVYVKYLMDKYQIDLKEPPEELVNGEKKQQEIIDGITKILENGDSVVGVLFPHTSLADHIVFNAEMQRWEEYQTAWIATKKFVEGKMGFAGMLAQAWLYLDNKTKMFWVTQAYLRDNMTEDLAEKARQENIDIMDEAVDYLAKGQSLLYFYPEGTRVRKSEKEDPGDTSISLSRSHPGAFTAAERAAEQSQKDIYLAPMFIGDVPKGKIDTFRPSKTEVTYGEPLTITQLREEYEELKDRIRFTDEAMRFHHSRNPAKKRLIIDGEKQKDQETGEKLYLDEPAEFGFADYVMWRFARLMPEKKRGIYGDDCVTIDEAETQPIN